MAKSYVYRGAPRDYHWLGHVEDGAVAYFEGHPPDDRWQETENPPAEAPVVDEHRVQRQDEAIAAAEELKQPNKAASAEDWKAYAAAHGGFEDATGTHPDDATRKAIVDHYTADQPAEAMVGAGMPGAPGLDVPESAAAGAAETETIPEPAPSAAAPDDAPRE